MRGAAAAGDGYRGTNGKGEESTGCSDDVEGGWETVETAFRLATLQALQPAGHCVALCAVGPSSLKGVFCQENSLNSVRISTDLIKVKCVFILVTCDCDV